MDETMQTKLDKVSKLVERTKKELAGYEQEWDINIGNLLIDFAEKYYKIMNTHRATIAKEVEKDE